MPLIRRTEQGMPAAPLPAPSQDLLRWLESPDPVLRRQAARELSAHAEAVPQLAAALEGEAEPVVQTALLAALQAIGGPAVAQALAPLLGSEDAALRNGAIEVLRGLGEDAGAVVRAALEAEDPDRRIFAVNILETLRHPEAADWLSALLRREETVNVGLVAIEALAQCGGPEHLPALRAFAERFAGEPFVAFAAEMVGRRLGVA